MDNPQHNSFQDIPSALIKLNIRTQQQETRSVTIARNSSVPLLKQEIQFVFDVAIERQRLIFQGRILKDNESLLDYANLDNGKVIHLVVRSDNSPSNPLNDTPNSIPNGPRLRRRQFLSPTQIVMVRLPRINTLSSRVTREIDPPNSMANRPGWANQTGRNLPMINSIFDGLSSINPFSSTSRLRRMIHGLWPNNNETNGLAATFQEREPPMVRFRRSLRNLQQTLQGMPETRRGNRRFSLFMPRSARQSAVVYWPYSRSIEMRLAESISHAQNAQLTFGSTAERSSSNTTNRPSTFTEDPTFLSDEYAQNHRERARQTIETLRLTVQAMNLAIPDLRRLGDSLQEIGETSESLSEPSTERAQVSAGLSELSLSNQLLAYVLANVELAESSNRMLERNSLNSPSNTALQPTLQEPDSDSNQNTQQASETTLETKHSSKTPVQNDTHSISSGASGLKRKREPESVDDISNKKHFPDTQENRRQDKGKGKERSS
ncbi:hypothetical protein CLU79DRAFT_727322 [Phycomyces nitens]|nr:hypothetical protein CLU79DRAFT_727322 [Phycomyces nitens]